MVRILCALLAAAQAASAATLAVDFGAEWTKASVVGPKMDILLNTDSKRKFQSIVGWKGATGERVFGTDAYSTAARFPTDTFQNLKVLLGAAFESDRVRYYRSIASTPPHATPRGTAGLVRTDGSSWAVEELVAMQLANIKHVADAQLGPADPVRDLVVAVPGWYSQFERQAIADAVEIAGLKLLAIVNDGAAVAVNYAMTRSFPTTEHHIFFDAGAASTSATLVSFSTTESAKTKAESTTLEVKGFGYDALLGGAELDRRLRDILVAKFDALPAVQKLAKSVRSDPKGLMKLVKEAVRVKTVLSVNTEASASVESLAFDVDFRAKVSRTELEDATQDLKARWAQPVLDAIAQSGLDISAISSIVLTGGSSRVPMVQQALVGIFGEDKLARNVNADEAAVIGASLYGAMISRHFRTKDIKVLDTAAYDLQVVYDVPSKEDPSTTRTIQSLLFPHGGKINGKKTLSLKRKEDFKIALEYKGDVPFPAQIVEASFVGVTEAIANLTEDGAIDPLVKVTISLDDSSFIRVDSAIAYGDIKQDESWLKNLFGSASTSATEGIAEATGSSSSSETEASSSAETSSAAPSPDASATTSDSSTSTSTTATPTPTPKKDTYNIPVTLHYASLPPLTSTEKVESRTKLRGIESAERNARLNSEARNVLEGYVYRIRDLLSGEPTSPFFEFSSASERKRLEEKLEEVSAWMADLGDTASTTDLIDKKRSLENIETPIQNRNKEYHAAPAAIADLQKALLAGTSFVTSAKENRTSEEELGFEPKYTLAEVDGVEKSINETAQWLEDTLGKQDKRKKNEDPYFKAGDVEARGKALQGQVMRLLKRRWIPKVKKTATPSAAEPTSTSTSTSDKAEKTHDKSEL